MDRASAVRIGKIDPKLKGKPLQAAVVSAMNPSKEEQKKKKQNA